MSNLYVFSLRMLNQIIINVDGTSIVTVDGKMFLTNTVTKEEFLHPEKFGATAIGSDVLSLYSG